MGYNIEGRWLFHRVLEVLGTFPSSGDSWDAPPPLKEWGSYKALEWLLKVLKRLLKNFYKALGRGSRKKLFWGSGPGRGWAGGPYRARGA